MPMPQDPPTALGFSKQSQPTMEEIPEMTTLHLHLHLYLLHLTCHEPPCISLLSMLPPLCMHANLRALCNSLFNCTLRKPSCMLPLWSLHPLQISSPFLLSIMILLMYFLRPRLWNCFCIMTLTSRLIWKKEPLLLLALSTPFCPSS
ncbi:hypothetical protein ID866_9250 [Astraeus odoratus]|nr:hypothetical protein ID866_9250 [Astraeus odoratus]